MEKRSELISLEMNLSLKQLRNSADIGNTSRQVTFEYFVNINSIKLPICIQALVSTLGIKIAEINNMSYHIKMQNSSTQQRQARKTWKPIK